MKRNPDWEIDELILALDLYFQLEPGQMNSNNEKIKELSSLLRILPIHNIEEVPDPEKFRNPNGVSMKLNNIKGADPNIEGGLRTDKGVVNVLKEFDGQGERLRNIANSIKGSFKEGELNASLNKIEITNEMEAPEGKLLLRRHLYRERRTKIVKAKKAQVLQEKGKLECEACSFDFEKKYGEKGEGFIECHHIIPLSEMRPGHRTKLDELRLLCSNCHRIIHRNRKGMLSMEELISMCDRNI